MWLLLILALSFSIWYNYHHFQNLLDGEITLGEVLIAIGSIVLAIILFVINVILTLLH